MIERHWKGIAKKERSNEYIHHLRDDTFKQLADMKGFISARILKRDINAGIEFLVVTEWETIDAIKQFAGTNLEMAVVPQLVQEIMVSYDHIVSHYEVV
jgi:heme-degrading monooxygenase HmoA